MFETRKIPFVPPTDDPYEECCAGSHDGEKLVIDLVPGLQLEIQEIRSGIGSTFNVYAVFENGERRGRFYTFLDDEGSFCTGFTNHVEIL